MVFRISALSCLFLMFLVSCGDPEKSPPPGMDRADILRATDPRIRAELNDPALTAVTREFGPAVIRTTNLPLASPLAASTVKPWSAWWYPTKDKLKEENSEGSILSALEKYDRYKLSRRGFLASSAKQIEKKNTSTNAYDWEGLCDAWSIASVSAPEPKRPVSVVIDGELVYFSISDLKVLLLKTYEAVNDSELKFYGQKFTGNSQGWVFPDIFPEEFHRLVEVQLFQKHEAFIMDHDPGIQIWNVPVYKANYTVNAVPNEPDSLFIRMWLYSAENVRAENRNSIGTKELVREYNYILTGKRNSSGDLIVDSGYWVIGPSGINSRDDHPDYLFRIAKHGGPARKSWNSAIDIDLVDEILSKSY